MRDYLNVSIYCQGRYYRIGDLNKKIVDGLKGSGDSCPFCRGNFNFFMQIMPPRQWVEECVHLYGKESYMAVKMTENPLLHKCICLVTREPSGYEKDPDKFKTQALKEIGLGEVNAEFIASLGLDEGWRPGSFDKKKSPRRSWNSQED